MNSTNIKVMSEEIQRLKDEVHNLDVEIPSHDSGDAGKYLGVDSSGYLEFSDPFPAVTSEDEGSLLTVNSSGEWAKGNPIIGNKDYSTIEQNTGVKWIDGKTIYRQVLSGTFPINSTPVVAGDIGLHETVTNIALITKTEVGTSYFVVSGSYSVSASGSVTVSTTSTAIQGRPFNTIVEYTKPTVTRDDDTNEEPETKKVTRKKTTK